jgi:hypothetical protein
MVVDVSEHYATEGRDKIFDELLDEPDLQKNRQYALNCGGKFKYEAKYLSSPV